MLFFDKEPNITKVFVFVKMETKLQKINKNFTKSPRFFKYIWKFTTSAKEIEITVKSTFSLTENTKSKEKKRK